MKKIIVGILVSITISSCMTKKRLDRICQLCPTETITTVRDSIVRKDSTVYLPGEVLTDTIRIECDENNKPFIKGKSKVQGKRGKAEVKQLSSNVFVNRCEIDSAAVAFSWNENHRTNETVKTIIIESKRKLNDFFYFCGIALWILVLIAFLILYPKYFHNKT